MEDVDIEEMTTRIAAGLKTWLNFGVTVAGNPKQQATFEPTPHAETHSQLKKMWSEQSAKLGKKYLQRNNNNTNNIITSKYFVNLKVFHVSY